MIGQFIALYKARKDPNLAKSIASEMIFDGVIDRASLPLTIGKFWMGVGIAVMGGFSLLFLVLAMFSHWSLAIPAIPLGGVAYGIIRIWIGINAGVENVTRLAKEELFNRTAAVRFPSRRSNENQPDLSPDLS